MYIMLMRFILSWCDVPTPTTATKIQVTTQCCGCSHCTLHVLASPVNCVAQSCSLHYSAATLITTHNKKWISMSRTRYKVSCNLGTRKISNAPVANHLYFTLMECRSYPLYALWMTLCLFIIPYASLVLESVEKISSFACHVGVKVLIHLGDSKIKDAKQKVPFWNPPSKGNCPEQ